MGSELTRDSLLTTLEQERATLLALLPRFSDDQWYNRNHADGWSAHDIATHLADSTYGLARIVLGEIPPPMPLNPETGWMDGIDAYNEQRRQKNANLSREKVLERTTSAIDYARRAIETIDDFAAPGPFGPIHTKGMWLGQIVRHTQEHRHDIEQCLTT